MENSLSDREDLLIPFVGMLLCGLCHSAGSAKREQVHRNT
jgi:hypothetical protein